MRRSTRRIAIAGLLLAAIAVQSPPLQDRSPFTSTDAPGPLEAPFNGLSEPERTQLGHEVGRIHVGSASAHAPLRQRISATSANSTTLVSGAIEGVGGVPCSSSEHAGGDWLSVNGDLHNSRNQSVAQAIGVAGSRDLAPVWSFSATEIGATGGMRSTPIVASGCVYIGLGQGYLGDRGDVVALDADNGSVVWHTRLGGSVLGLAAAHGMIYATPSEGTRGDVALPVVTEDYAPSGSYVVALDAVTGDVVWTSERLDDGDARNGTFINASPVVFEAGGRSMVFVPLSGGSGDGARVPMYFLDALTGSTIKKAYTLSPDEYEAGFGGTGIWSTAAYDAAERYLYAGTADSDGHTRQHPYNNAILKIDADPRRESFGSVVGAYSGTSEHADLDPIIGYPNNPVCGALAPFGLGGLPTFFDTSASPECLELDFDFGSSPNLYTDETGRLKVGALQKSGIFHSVDAAAMQADWTFFAGPGGAAMHASTAAVGGGAVYVAPSPNLLVRIAQKTGEADWLSTSLSDAFAYQPLTLANGVLYKITDAGWLIGFDARSGEPLLLRNIASDGGFWHCLGTGAGVAVAYQSIYAPCDAGGLHDLAGIPGPPGGLVAYR